MKTGLSPLAPYTFIFSKIHPQTFSSHSIHSTWAKTSIPLAYYKCVDDTKLFFDSVFLPKLHIFSLSVYQIFPFHDYTSTQDPTGIQESLEEAWVGDGLLQGWGH